MEEPQNGKFPRESSGDGQSYGSKRKKGKLIRRKEERQNLILGVDIQMDEAMEASELILLGRTKGWQYSTNYITEWIQKSWCEGLATQTEVIILTRGWFMVIFLNGEAMDWVL